MKKILRFWFHLACSPIMCLMFCEYGFVNDKNGCKICKCNKPTTTRKGSQNCF